MPWETLTFPVSKLISPPLPLTPPLSSPHSHLTPTSVHAMRKRNELVSDSQPLPSPGLAEALANAWIKQNSGQDPQRPLSLGSQFQTDKAGIP